MNFRSSDQIPVGDYLAFQNRSTIAAQKREPGAVPGQTLNRVGVKSISGEDALNKLLFGAVLFLAFTSNLVAQQLLSTTERSSERTFFPRDTFWGYGQFDLAPPHNEIDPNICRADAGNFGGASAPCTAFARYMLSGYVEMRPFGRGQLRKFFLFGEPRFLFGRNVPQTVYTWSFDAIGAESSWGGGVLLGKGFEMRITQHLLFSRFGNRDQHLGPADLGPNGPWGRYNVVGIRKYFGTRRW